MTPAVHRLALADGVTSVVEVSGTGPAVVLLHGFTGDASTLGGLTERLAADHTVVVPNLIGHGGSHGPAGHYGVDAMASQVIGSLAALDVAAPFDLVGYSMGGRVALTLACRFPARVASLTLIGASAGLASERERAERRAADESLADSITAGGLETFVDRWMANPLFSTQARLGSAFLAEARTQRLGNSGEELARSLREAGTGVMTPLHELLPQCAMPVGLVVGADDPKFRAIAAGLTADLPDARVHEIAEAGHAAHLEKPDAVARAIRSTVGRGAVRVAPISLPMVGGHATARGVTTHRDGVLVGLRADGVTGWGEASPLPGWSVDDLDALVPRVGEHAVAVTDSAWDDTGSWRASLDDHPAGRAAVAGAALDLDARRSGIPLFRHLAGWHSALDPSAVLDQVAVNALVSAIEPAAVAAAVHGLVARGHHTIKLKVGVVAPAVDQERVAAARRAGPDIALRLDANGGWDHPTALSMLDFAADHGVVLCEEPVAGIDEIAAVGRRASVPVAVDESVRRIDDFRRVADHAEAIQALVVKPQALGGADRAIDIILAAAAAGLDVIVTSMIDSAVGVAHAAHVAAACGLPSAHGLATADLLERDTAAGLSVVDGSMAMPTTPGLGVGLVSPGPPTAP